MKLTATLSLLAGILLSNTISAAPPTSGTELTAGKGVHLNEVSPTLLQLKKSDLTMEFWIRPDAATITRPRALMWLLTSQSGYDVAGMGMSLIEGRVNANILGVKLNTTDKLDADEWVHLCLTLQSGTLNKVATLWINGRPIDRKRVGQPWPDGFYYARLMGDPWNQQRFFSGTLGGIRFSRQLRYRSQFEPAASWQKDDDLLLLIDGASIPLK